jgi:HAMP domain-containing protein
MLRKSALRVLFLSPFVVFLTPWSGAQSSQTLVTPYADAGSSSPAPTEQQEMRDELKALRAEVERLRAEVEEQKGAVPGYDRGEVTAPAKTSPGPNGPSVTAMNLASPKAMEVSGRPVSAATSTSDVPAKKPKIDPFSDWDWTWLNGNPRTKEAAFDSKFFTPEIRADVSYTYDFNKPKDDSMGGSSELFRSNEIQLEQLGIGGDFHYDNVRARFMTQYGMYSTTTVRNDPSPAKGQWDLGNAHRYLAEAYGGYHFNALDGINVDAGIFLSYIGLFSYYNFDNWAYQPSYVSSNTPWFFEGLRVQIFPNPHLKIEPWLINGWQSYGSANSRKGLGGQIKWTPRPWIDVISNNYGLGHDDLYIPNRGRIHTDDSVEIKYYDKPEKSLDKMAFSFTGDLGCEFGGGVSCLGNRKGPGGTINPKQSFVGYMLYNRMWFKKDRYGLTVGGGQINNPGRYLVLIPPINGETAPSAAINSPYFTGNPGDPFKAWDTSATFDYMPSQYITFRWEYDYRHASVPYWTGAGGITPPPGSNNGFPQYYACSSGATSGQATLSGAETACGSPGSTSSVWFPDLRRDEHFIDMAILVKF